MSEIVRARLMEICPADKVADMSIDELRLSVRIAFKIIGYKPIDSEKAIQKALDNFTGEWLYQFIFDVWGYDQ